MDEQEKRVDRRQFLRSGVRGACLVGLGGAVGFLATRSRGGDLVWQLDPEKCTQCGNCASYCVLKPSAVKCVQAYAMCGYCDLCTGYFEPEPNALNTAAENQLCPTGAIRRRFIEEPYFEYDIYSGIEVMRADGPEILDDLCIGCGKCVEGCRAFGNGSFYLQVRHDRCLNCNDCSIAAACPTQAFQRVPASQPNIHPKGYVPTPRGNDEKP